MSPLGCLLIFALVLGSSGHASHHAPTQKLIFPAIQVLTYITEANWRTKAGKDSVYALRAALLEEAKNANATSYTEYSNNLLNFLIGTSENTAKDQLDQILQRLLSNGELTTSRARGLITNFLRCLNDKKSETHNVLKNLPPLIYN